MGDARESKRSDRKRCLKGRSVPLGDRGCPTGKRAFRTAREARDAAKLVRQTGQADAHPNRPLRAFRCSACSQFHFGHDRLSFVSMGSVDFAGAERGRHAEPRP